MKRTIHFLTLFVLTALLGACASGPVTSSGQMSAEERGTKLAQQLLIIDTHIDVPYRLESKPDDVTKATESGDFA